jgi:hypothetical protein
MNITRHGLKLTCELNRLKSNDFTACFTDSMKKEQWLLKT